MTCFSHLILLTASNDTHWLAMTNSYSDLHSSKRKSMSIKTPIWDLYPKSMDPVMTKGHNCSNLDDLATCAANTIASQQSSLLSYVKDLYLLLSYKEEYNIHKSLSESSLYYLLITWDLSSYCQVEKCFQVCSKNSKIGTKISKLRLCSQLMF